MFKKDLKRQLVGVSDNPFEYKPDYASLMQFISKNVTIPSKLKSLESQEDQANIDTLLEAMGKLDFTNKIFEHPNCQLYSLYLFKNETITLDDFLTINIYLMALMQFTDKQNLKEVDQDVKRNAEVSVVSLAETEVQQIFIGHLNRLYFRDYPISETQFEKAIEHLNGLGGIAIKININDSKDWVRDAYEGPEAAMEELSAYGLLPFVDDVFYIPSSALLKALTKIINEDIKVRSNDHLEEKKESQEESKEFHLQASEPESKKLESKAVVSDAKQVMEMAPLFGRVNSHTMYLMHQAGYHPVNLYSVDVISNLEKIHSIKGGPIPSLLHDMIGHVFWGNLLTKKQFEFMFHYLIPKIGETLNVTIDDASLGLIGAIDVDIYIPNNDIMAKNSFINFAIKSALYFNNSEEFDNHIANGLKILELLFNEQDQIYKNFGIDLKDVMCSPTFMNLKNGLNGEDLYNLLEESRVTQVPVHELYEKKYSTVGMSSLDSRFFDFQ